ARRQHPRRASVASRRGCLTVTMPTSSEVSDYQWLVSPAAREALRDAANSELPLHQLATELRKEHSPSRTSLVLDQRELRERARDKFALSADMYFTRVALQQATDQWVAAYKAQRFSGFENVGDVCTGIGGDLLALAAVAQAAGIDMSPVATILAQANLSANSRSAQVVLGQASPDFVAPLDAWHADPDRRPTGRRTSIVEQHSPDAAVLDTMLRANPNAAIKLSPASAAPVAWQQQAELEWVSRARECRQQVAWFGALAGHAGARRATRLDAQGAVVGSFVGAPNTPADWGEELGDYLYEPDPAVLAASLQGALAAGLNLPSVAREVAYFTSCQRIDHPLLTRFRVMERLPSLRLKSVAAHLRERGVGRLEIKHRGWRLDPEQFRKQLNLRGDNSAVLVVYPHLSRPLGVVVEREDSEPPVR
ncbi:MAG: hypothetical protein KDA37_16640, partial [Planctomycetales bacterium]|nr:hypothetical protein [Planctomycetales bacterium]